MTIPSVKETFQNTHEWIGDKKDILLLNNGEEYNVESEQKVTIAYYQSVGSKEEKNENKIKKGHIITPGHDNKLCSIGTINVSFKFSDPVDKFGVTYSEIKKFAKDLNNSNSAYHELSKRRKDKSLSPKRKLKRVTFMRSISNEGHRGTTQRKIFIPY